MLLRIVAVDRYDDDEGKFYRIFSELHQLEDGKDHMLEFSTEVDEQDLENYRFLIENKARELLDTYSVAKRMIGEEWRVPDKLPGGKVVAA